MPWSEKQEEPVHDADRDPVGLLLVVSLELNDDLTRASTSSPESLSAVSWLSGGLSFKVILKASAKEYWREARSREEVLIWAFMTIIVQFASPTFEKHDEMAWPVHEQRQCRTEVKGEKLTFHLSYIYDFPLFHSLKREMGIHSSGSVDFRWLQWWTTKVTCSSEPVLSTFVAWSGRVNKETLNFTVYNLIMPHTMREK